jgi:2-haloalkanoic acid dehalogenase type II
MRANVEVVCFDCYGTLIDARGGLAAFLYLLARGCGENHPPPGFELARSFLTAQERVIQEGFYGFDAILTSSLREVAADRRWRLESSDFESLAQCMGTWQPYPDARSAVRHIQARGLKTGMIANCSSRIIEHTLRQLDVSFDSVAISDCVRAYQADLCEQLIRDLEIHPRRVLHVSGSPVDDLAVAKALGCRTAWLNRTGARPPDNSASPDYEWRSLWELVDLKVI